MSKSHKAQHFVPASYLSAWCDPAKPVQHDPYVWTYPRSGGIGKHRAPQNIFTETDLYTITRPDGERDLRVEMALGDAERRFARLRRKRLAQHEPLSEEEHVDLVVFVAALHTRTQRFRDHHKEFWDRIVKAGDDMMSSMAKKTPEERERMTMPPSLSSGPSMTHEQARAVAESPLEHVMGPAIEAELQFLPYMQATILDAPDSKTFITSDNPVTWHNPAAGQKPLLFRGPALLDKEIEITMPISPQQLLLITHADEPGLTIKPIRYEMMPTLGVPYANRDRSLHADKTIVADNGAADFDWFTE